MKIKNGFVLREICGENVISEEGLSNVNMGRIICLNESAAFLLKSVWNEDFTPESLADMLQKEYEISDTQALEDSKALCKSLKDNGIAE